MFTYLCKKNPVLAKYKQVLLIACEQNECHVLVHIDKRYENPRREIEVAIVYVVYIETLDSIIGKRKRI